ncbi:class I SAM-dependent methyltransferase [Desulfoferrobacter suflitae]|uniref:class I SAM-dependent methyltransferase n=1 Tax=Desulfoferrobacter suflitae TaxID=2865782 RepID=UPI00216446B8|nr:class I SAM-dependent methyltransferase [Desulfoferrobacter suflitae]MCK8600676.1 class I SAM-dependent methyltransferase [Desulfoferrobacter suflitae]
MKLKGRAFSEKMVEVLNYGAINLAMAIGYRTGLYDVLDTFDTPQPITAIARESGLNPRYLQEWMGVMVTAGIIEISHSADGEHRFFLPKEHADYITRRAGNSNLGVYTQEIPLLTLCAMEEVFQGFHTGQGIDYHHYPKFQSFMSELADAKHRKILVDQFLPSVDEGKLVERLKRGIHVCDVGCAEGVAVLLMAQAFPNSRFLALDLSPEAIRMAREGAHRRQVTNVEFLILDAATLETHERFSQRFDYVTAFDSIHDQTRPMETLRGIHHILADGGLFSMVDIAAQTDMAENLDHPMAPFLYTVSLMHCMPVGLVDGGAGLGMMWGRQKALEMLKKAGFKDLEVVEMPFDAFNWHFLCRK